MDEFLVSTMQPRLGIGGCIIAANIKPSGLKLLASGLNDFGYLRVLARNIDAS